MISIVPTKSSWRAVAAAVAVITLAFAVPALAASCGNSGAGFNRWLANYKAQAAARGISRSTISKTLGGVTYHRRIVRLDRSQKSFKLSFKQFYARRVGSALMRRARSRMSKYARLLRSIEKRYGVPAPILISIWGLETNFGRDTSGKYSIVRSVATLAYDCRRSEFFSKQLFATLQIVDRGYIPASSLRGGWAGEIGQTQFLPLSYVRYAVDYDGDGRRDLVRSVPDLLASTATFRKGHGWKRGQGWAPGSTNYGVLKDWNRASVYQRTISVMADKLSR